MAEAATETFGQRINIELGTEVVLDIQGVEGKVKSNLVGLVPSEFLIIATPVGVTGIRQRLFDGNKVTLRYKQDGFVYGFETQIITMVTKPKSMLILHYPQKSASVTLRKSERVCCFVNCTLEIDNKDYPGTIMDISKSGCRCLVPMLSDTHKRTIDKDGMEAKLTFTAPNDKSEMEVWVKIVNQVDERAASKLGMGFVEPEEELAGRIKRLCEFLDR